MAYDPNAPISTLGIPKLFRNLGGSTINYFDENTGKIGSIRDEDIKNRPTGFSFGALPEMNLADVLPRIAESYGFKNLNEITDDALSGEIYKDFGSFYNKVNLANNPVTEITKTRGAPGNPEGSTIIRNGELLQSPTADKAIANANSQNQQPIPPKVQQPTFGQSSYTGLSLVDYLRSVGQPSDFASRARLAQQTGIEGYRGTAEQNTQLLNTLRGGKGIAGQPSQGGIQVAGGQVGQGTQGGQGLGQGFSGVQVENKSPTNFVERYKGIVDELGLTSIKREFEKVQQEYTDLQNKMNEEVSKVNDNPWISEAERSRRVSSIQDKYERKTSIVNKKIELYDTLYQRGIAEARYLATGAEEEENRLADLALKEKEAMRKLTEFDASVFKEVRGGLFDIKSGKWIVQPKQDSGDTGGVLAGLPAALQGRIVSIAGDFGSNQITKRFNATVDSLNVVNGIATSSKNPADHQTIIYSFAKSLDPESVVREGEYATIKKYAQSLINRYGKEVENAINGTGFLSQSAIASIKETMNRNYESAKPAYDNLYKQTASVVDNIAGKPVAASVLVDYSKGFVGGKDTPGGGSTDGVDPADVKIGSTFVQNGLIYLRQSEDSFIPIGTAR